MKTTTAWLAALLFGALGPAYALYSVSYRGEWPQNWPKQLEPLRKQSCTFVGPTAPNRHYAIRFTRREEFTSAWSHLLKVKSKGAPVFLVRGPNFFLGEHSKAGVVVHCPPLGQSENPATPEAPIPGVTNPRERWMNTTFLEVVVDDDIVNWKRIALPRGTPVIDERYPAREKQK